MLQWLTKRLLRPKPARRPIIMPNPRRVVFAAACLDSLKGSLSPKIRQRHEGIVYFLGHTDGRTTLIAAICVPKATTTEGSFYVSEMAMRPVVEAANAAGLQVVGQLHTHPRDAYHSEGDEAGALIRHNGFTSIVIPNYGTWLPNLDKAAIYMYSTEEHRFIRLRLSAVSILPTLLQNDVRLS